MYEYQPGIVSLDNLVEAAAVGVTLAVDDRTAAALSPDEPILTGRMSEPVIIEP